MGRIRVLPDGVVSRIAAGEVVERPASVAKELVENSLDAGARSIEVRLSAGGKSSLVIQDDGCGMEPDDVVLAVERHATSKLASAEDLEAIRTLGFRGEALSAIAAVSRLILTTAPRDGEGHELTVHDGRRGPLRRVAHPQGTTVRVEQLFASVPARRKFLRSDATELAHILRWMTRYALCQPGRRFVLRQGARTLFDTAAATDSRQRLVQVFGQPFVDRLLPVELSLPGLAVQGYAGRPAEALPRRDAQHFFVNGRAVQDRVLTHAVAQAYGNTMPAGRHPALVLFLEIDPAAVDVNVHPQKTEVRFRESQGVHEAVRAALAQALAQPAAVAEFAELRPRAGQALSEVREATLGYLATEPAAGCRADDVAPGPAKRATPAVVGARRPGARPLAQYRDSYIVAQDEDGLVIVDQHAAHERVLFERYLDAAEANRVEVQPLLFPVSVELTAEEHLAAEREREEWARLGFVLESFGERTVRLDAVPAVASGLDPASFLRELLGAAGQARSAVSGVAALRRRLITTAACHAAIKIRHPLGPEAMQALLDDLYATRSPSTCPHGRPVLFRLGHDEIERAFRRR